MENFLSETEKNAIASKKVEQIKSIYTHFGAYLSINVVLLILMFSEAVKLPVTFWQTTFGITAGLGAFGVAAHYIAVFGYKLLLPKNWEDRKLKEFMDKENNNKI